jgi:hypothetical protein
MYFLPSLFAERSIPMSFPCGLSHALFVLTVIFLPSDPAENVLLRGDATIPLFELPLTTSTFLAETVSVSALYALTSTV